MQCYWMREGGTLLSYRPCMAEESEANAAGKLDTRSESRKTAFDHHDTLHTRMPGAIAIGIFCTYFTTIQAVTVVKGLTDCYDTLYCPMRSNTERADFLAFAIKVNSYGSPILH